MTSSFFLANTYLNSAFRLVVTDVSRARSVVAVVGGILLVLGVFGFIYWREWYLRRG